MAAAHRNIKRLTLWIVGAVIGLPLLLLLFFVVGSTFPGGDGGVVSVADRLKPKPDWVLERDRLTPDTWINLGSIPDPSIRRTWQVPGTRRVTHPGGNEFRLWWVLWLYCGEHESQ